MKRVLIVIALVLGIFVVGPAFAADKCVDVETASAKALEGLKGVGPKIAAAIIKYRKDNRTAATKAKKPTWNFRNWATLMKVPGVGPKICADNVATVCFSGKVQKTCPAK